MMDQQELQQYNNNYDGHEGSNQRGRRSSLLLSPSPMKDDWRQKLFNLIESKPIGTILFVLLAIDILIIFVDLFLDGYYPKCSYIVRDAICTTNMYGKDDDYSGTNAATCETHHNVESTREVLEILSYCILCIFAIENVLLVGVLGPTNFFGNWTNTFDFCIVFISFVLESSSMYFKDKIGDNILEDLVGFIILGRLVKFATLSLDLIKIEMEEENVQVERLQEQIHELLRQQSVLLKQQQQQQRQHDDNDNDSSTGYHKLT